jgi:sortase A
MAMYRYVKAVPKKPLPRPILASYIFMGIGVLIIGWTVWPILSFYAFDRDLFVSTVSPVGDVLGSKPLTPVVLAASGDELSDPNKWYPTKPQKKIVAPVNSYSLSIPKLNLDNATVIIAGDDLNNSIIHYGGTGLPGEYGNAVMFGHSTLPQFYKGAKDYHAVFSTLPTIKIGDDIIVKYDGVTYTYEVFDKVVVEPTDLSPLEQKFDDSYITLVTCVPPGTYFYRLNVKARLKRI